MLNSHITSLQLLNRQSVANQNEKQAQHKQYTTYHSTNHSYNEGQIARWMNISWQEVWLTALAWSTWRCIDRALAGR